MTTSTVPPRTVNFAPTVAARRFSSRVGRFVAGSVRTKGESKEHEGGRINWWGRDVDWDDRLGFRGRQDVESPLWEWTRLEVTADRDRITTRVNGTVVNQGTGSSLTEGKILVQSEGAEMFVRRMELHPVAVERSKSP